MKKILCLLMLALGCISSKNSNLNSTSTEYETVVINAKPKKITQIQIPNVISPIWVMVDENNGVTCYFGYGTGMFCFAPGQLPENK